VTIEAAGHPSFRVEARSRSGSIRADRSLTIEENTRRLLRGRVGDGLGRVSVETGSGRIRIR
jgi:hypothetical protein